MNRRTAACMALWLGLLGVHAATAWGEGGSAAERFSPGSITSDESARQALEAAAAERDAVQARFAREESACYERFFVNRCLDEANERRRQALEPLDEIELEAERFQRLQRAQERDRDMIERQKRAQEQEQRATAIAPPAVPARREPPPPAPVPKPRKPRSAPTPEQEQAAARERVENEAAYARKVQAARKRQETVARRKAEKDRRRALRRQEESVQAAEAR